MNILIHGASNVIAIGNARVLCLAGHRVVFSDTNKFARAFFSRYCTKRYLFKNPLSDRVGFAADLANCVEHEAIELIVPTTDQALLELAEAKDAIPDDVILPFPFDVSKLRYVSNKVNLPEICRVGGIKTPLTCSEKDYRKDNDRKPKIAPVVVKRAIGLAGVGFVRVEKLEMLDGVLAASRQKFPSDDLLIQEFIDGKVYGAGGVFDGQKLHRFYSYEYVRRHPSGSGSPTVCLQGHLTSIKAAMEKALAVLQWQGYCQMDFIVDSMSEEPCLVDINPVHWYTMPFSSSEELNSLFYYLGGGEHGHAGKTHAYTTICLSRELLRILASIVRREPVSGSRQDCREYLVGFRRADFFWDPFPLMLAPFFRLFRFVQRCRG